jgi:hypothetical protein
MVPRFEEERLRLLEVDDVDLVAMAVDVRGHLRVPEARLVSEMDTGFQHLTHGYSHVYSEGWVLNSSQNRLHRRQHRSAAGFAASSVDDVTCCDNRGDELLNKLADSSTRACR